MWLWDETGQPDELHPQEGCRGINIAFYRNDGWWKIWCIWTSAIGHPDLQDGNRLLFSFPAPCVGIPNAVGEQAIEIGKVWITVDVKAQASAIVLARPLAGPHLPSRIIAMEVCTAERRPAAVRTTLNVASPGSLQRLRRGANAQPSPQKQPVAQRDLCVVRKDLSNHCGI